MNLRSPLRLLAALSLAGASFFVQAAPAVTVAYQTSADPAKVAQAVLAEQVAQRQLSNLWGETKADIQLNATSMPWPDQSDATVQRYIAEGWLEKLYALNIQQSNLNIESLKVQAHPNPTLNVGMKRSQAPNENSDTTLGVGVDIPLNIFNRQQYSIPMAQRQQSLLNQQQQRELKQQIF